MRGLVPEGYVARLVSLTAALLLFVPAVSAADAERLAREFALALRSGDVARARTLIDTRYRSLPREGVDALFRYESGYQPNLAFLVGQPFDVGPALTVGNIRSEWFVLDRTHGRQLALPLTFDGGPAPYVLPSPIAFGRAMAFVDFMNFVKQPDRERYAALTLRIRPSVAPGRITPPPARTIAAPPPPVAGDQSARRPAVAVPEPGLEGGLLGAPRPRDPGPVVLPSGEALTPAQLEALLPRVRAVTLRVTVMQRGPFAAWRVEDVGVSDVVLRSHGIEIPLR